jgi:hypothetical protein
MTVMATARAQRPAGSGWFTFAAVLFTLAGVSNLLWGIGALDDKEYLPEGGLLASNLTVWGWVSIVWGLAALTGAVLLFMRNPWSAGVAIMLATLNAMFWLFAIPVLPIWSLVVIAMDVLIIYGLAVHSDVVDT